jgi:hypothetical protein
MDCKAVAHIRQPHKGRRTRHSRITMRATGKDAPPPVDHGTHGPFGADSRLRFGVLAAQRIDISSDLGAGVSEETHRYSDYYLFHANNSCAFRSLNPGLAASRAKPRSIEANNMRSIIGGSSAEDAILRLILRTLAWGYLPAVGPSGTPRKKYSQGLMSICLFFRRNR